MKRITLALAAIVALTLTACSRNEQLDDAPVGQIDDTPALILTNADQFPNIAVKCYGVNGLYTTTRGEAGALHIVANDPQCGGDPKLTVISG